MSTNLNARIRASFTLAVLWLMLPAGCGYGPGQGAKNFTVDKGVAQQSLTKTLDAWKAGQSAESLKDQKPSIVAVVPAWNTGAKLMDYKIGAEQDLGANLQVQVELTLDQNGVKQVPFTIGTTPVVTVSAVTDE